MNEASAEAYQCMATCWALFLWAMLALTPPPVWSVGIPYSLHSLTLSGFQTIADSSSVIIHPAGCMAAWLHECIIIVQKNWGQHWVNCLVNLIKI